MDGELTLILSILSMGLAIGGSVVRLTWKSGRWFGELTERIDTVAEDFERLSERVEEGLHRNEAARKAFEVQLADHGERLARIEGRLEKELR